MEEVVAITHKEIERTRVLSDLNERKITQLIAAKKLRLSERQIRRLLVQLKNQRITSILSKKRAKPSNRSLSKELKHSALSLVQVIPFQENKFIN